MIGRLLNLALIVVTACCLWVAAGRAVDHELANGALTEGATGVLPASAQRTATDGVSRAGRVVPAASRHTPAPSVSACGASSVSTFKPVPTVTSCYQGRSARWWAKRAVQARKDANARARTIERLKVAQRNDAAHFFAWLRGADCVQGKEARWNYDGPTYDGGMQADRSFQRAYGSPYLQRWGPAFLWPWWAQLHMAYNGWVARGWQPWPNTARACGLL